MILSVSDCSSVVFVRDMKCVKQVKQWKHTLLDKNMSTE